MKTYTQEDIDNDVPELEAIYAEHKRNQLADIELCDCGNCDECNYLSDDEESF